MSRGFRHYLLGVATAWLIATAAVPAAAQTSGAPSDAAHPTAEELHVISLTERASAYFQAKLRELHGRIAADIKEFDALRLRREEIFRTHPRSGPSPLTAQREVDEIDAKISALQRRTDDAKDAINRATFTYEQYLKIAGQVLSQLTEIIKKFAANPARS